MSLNVTLSGSYRQHPSKSIAFGKPALDEIIQITLLLRRRLRAPEPNDADGHLSHDQLAAWYGADPDDLLAVEAFAAEHNFSILKQHVGARTVTLSGPLGPLAAAFGTNLELRLLGNRVFRSRQGELHVPESLKDRVVAVLGFDERPVAATNHRVSPRTAQPSSHTPLQLAALYNFPQNTGLGQTIALIELDGGYDPADLATYWSSLGLPHVSVTPVSVEGAQNAPTGDPNGPDGEVVLDIQVAGAVASGANIAVYFAPNTDQGFLDAINTAIHDTDRRACASCSWRQQNRSRSSRYRRRR
jgi:kumamolisin